MCIENVANDAFSKKVYDSERHLLYVARTRDLTGRLKSLCIDRIDARRPTHERIEIGDQQQPRPDYRRLPPA
jgi:hypothetical protein